MKIERINKGNWGKVIAFFDVRTSDGIIVKGWSLVEGNNGVFVGKPSKKNNDGEYHDIAWIPDDNVKDELLRLAKEAYGGGLDNERQPESSAPEDFGDDSIPF